MAERLITPNTVTQNIVLSGYGKAGKLDQTEKVLSGMLEGATAKPDVWTMNSILTLLIFSFVLSGRHECTGKCHQ